MATKKQSFFMIMRIIVVFVMGLIVAVFVALSQMDLETLRGDIVALLRDATGTPIEISGDVSWRFSLRPQIELNQVRIPNESWAKHEYAFSAERVYVRLNLFSLFRNRPTIQRVKIYDATIALEQNSDGQYSVKKLSQENDVYASDRGIDEKIEDAEQAENVAPVKAKYPFVDLGLGGVEIKNVVAYILGDTYSLGGFSVRYVPRADSREYSGWVKVDEDVQPFIVSFSEYNAERKIYPVQVALATGGAALIADIALEGTSLAPIDFRIKGDVPDVEKFGRMINVDLSDVPSLSVNIAGGIDRKKLTLRSSAITLRGVDFAVSGSVNWSKKTPAYDIQLETKKLDVKKTFPELYSNGTWVRPERELNAFKDMPLYGQELFPLNLKLRVLVNDLIVYRDIDIRNVDVALRLKDGHGRVDAKAVFADGQIRVGGNVDITPDGNIDVVAGLSGQGVSIGTLMKQIRINNLISGLPMNIEFYGRAHGKDMSEWMQTLNGPVRVYSTDKGYAHETLVENIYGTDFLTTLRHSIQDLFTDDKHNKIKISCAVANVMLRDGLVRTRNGVAVETNSINVRLAGDVDLGKETMRLSLTTVPVRGLKLSLTGNVVNSIELTGNLSEPEIKINGAAVAGKVASATGLGLLLAPFTGGLSLVAGAGVGLLAGDLLENWLADDTPCKTALERGVLVSQEDPEWMHTPVEELVGDILENKQ